MTSAAERLVAVAARHAGADPLHWRQRVERLLGAPLAGLQPAPATSALNADGMPLQWCLSLAGGPPRSRLLCDPAFTEADPQRRRRNAFEATRALCDETGLAAAADRVLGHARLAQACGPVGPLWLAFGAADGALALYLDSRLAGDAGQLPDWQTFLDDVASPAARQAAAAWIAPARQRLAAIGLDLGRQGVTALTLYCRPCGDTPGSLAHFAGNRRGRAMLRALCGDTVQPAAGVTAAVSVRVPDGQVLASKIDLCRCPRCKPAANLARDPAPEQALLSLDPTLRASDLAACSRLALVGIAARAERPHVNLYFEPTAC